MQNAQLLVAQSVGHVMLASRDVTGLIHGS
jgi:hypothetical protein